MDAVTKVNTYFPSTTWTSFSGALPHCYPHLVYFSMCQYAWGRHMRAGFVAHLTFTVQVQIRNYGPSPKLVYVGLPFNVMSSSIGKARILF
jgi:hypothetical protein